MNKSLIRRWVAALESGRYKQGQERLRTEGNGYCCLGVLCTISELGKWKKEKDAGWQYLFKLPEDQQYRGPYELNQSVIESGLEEAMDVKGLDQGSLSSFNDSGEWTFKRIANYLRQTELGQKGKPDSAFIAVKDEG